MSEADDSGANSAVAGEMMGLQLFFSRVKRQLVWWRRRFVPMLVWYGDEVDVGVQFSREKLDPESPFDVLEMLRSDLAWVTAKIRARQAEVDAAVREGLRRSPEPDLGLFGRWLGDFAGDGTPLPDNCDCFGCVGYRNILAAWRDQRLPDSAGSADIA